MRYTFGSAAILAGLVLVSTAFWPEAPHAPAPRPVEAQSALVAKTTEAAAVENPARIRQVVRVSHLPATDLANALGMYFIGEPTVQIVPEPLSNSVLISGLPSQVAEAVQTLHSLDRPERPVAVDVAIVELRTSKPGDHGFPQALDAREFEGPVAEIRDKLQALISDRRVRRIKRFHIQALGNQMSHSEDSEDEARDDTALPAPASPQMGVPVRSRSASPRRRAGTTIHFTPRISADGRIAALLSVVDSPRLSTPEAGAAAGSAGTEAVDIESKYDGTITLFPGRTAVVHSIERGNAQMLLIVSADMTDRAADKPVEANGP